MYLSPWKSQLTFALGVVLLVSQALAFASGSNDWSVSQDGHPDLGTPYTSTCHDLTTGDWVCLMVACKDAQLTLLFNFSGGDSGIRVGDQLPVTVSIDGAATKIRMTRQPPSDFGELLQAPLRASGELLDELMAGSRVTVAPRGLKAWTFLLRHSRSTIGEVRRSCGAADSQRTQHERVNADPAIAGRLPHPAQAHLDVMESMCQQLGGRLKGKDLALLTADFNRDGRSDYAIDQVAVMCIAAASLFSGSGGSTVTVFVSEPSGYREVWSGGSYGARVEGGRLWLGLAGPACGYAETARSEARSCERVMVWNASRRRMEFSEIIQGNR